jgi:cell division protein FtsZ
MTNYMFDLPKDQSSIIKVIGVGGGGSNAVNHMFTQGIHGVNYVVCNTDAQALELSPIPNKIQLGPELTEGLGAGSNPEQGRLAAEESIDEIRSILSKNTKMVFVTACMGGGTGTGAAPVVARIAREMGILTVGIATMPFNFEGKRKYQQAKEGVENLKAQVDTILLISNDKVREMYGNLSKSEAFSNANNILTTAAKSISEIITIPGEINVDFADVKHVMAQGGSALMGCATAEGENRAMNAVQGALNSPLLNDNDIRGAKKFLVNISSGSNQVTIDEITEINEYVQMMAQDTDIIFGTCDDLSLGEKISVTIIATGFESSSKLDYVTKDNKVVFDFNSAASSVSEVEVRVQQEKPSLSPVPAPSEKIEEIFVQDLSEDLNLFSQPAVQELDKNTPVVFTLEEPAPSLEEVFSLDLDAEIKPIENAYNFELNSQPFSPAEEEELSPPDLSSINTEEITASGSEVFAEFKIVSSASESAQSSSAAKDDDRMKDLDERKKALLNLSYRSGNKSMNINELESTPAYLRQGMDLNSGRQFSTEAGMSRFSVGESSIDSEKPEIRRNNSFLHDNVD